MTDTFESERLTMRRTRIDDAEALFEAYGDVDLMRYWSTGPHASVDESRVYLAPRPGNSDWRGWTMVRKQDGRVIGTLAAGVRRSGVAEIGYMLVRSAWGQGFAQEGVARLIDLLVREEGKRRIFADTDPDNDASNRLLDSLGFQREGLLRAEWETHIGVRDTVAWGLLADEWLALAPRPRLHDEAGRAAYAGELRSIARPLRLTGLAFLLLGLALGVVRRMWWPNMPAAIPLAALALGVLNMLGGVAARNLYDARRMMRG